MSWYDPRKRRRKLRPHLEKAAQLSRELREPKEWLWCQYGYSLDEEVERFFKKTKGIVELQGARDQVRGALLDRRLMSALEGRNGSSGDET